MYDRLCRSGKYTYIASMTHGRYEIKYLAVALMQVQIRALIPYYL